MRKIYLASDSRARKKLLSSVGVKFKVVTGKVRERRRVTNISCARLVENNALQKAKAVAKQVKSGIIIGADTIVVAGGKIFGKPKNLKDARIMLKNLAQKPQWLYTGLAIVDQDKKKTLLGYEKTKIYMDKINDRQISSYFTKVSPLDKAGSFDIQGRGAFFIRRIEGCFYNVVGLPLRKLYRMFKELDVNLLIIPFFALQFAFYALLSGCSTEYNIVTGKEESFYYSTDKEVQIGQSIAKQVEEEYKLTDDPLITKRIEDIGKKIVSVSDRQDIDYIFKVIEDDEINAFALPGGFIYINKGLIDKVASDDELAGVLAHEVGHIVARHSIKKLQAMMAYSLLRILTSQVPQGQGVGNAADLAFTEIILGYSRDDELLADQLASRYAKLAGYNPREMITFLERLQEINRRKPLRPKTYFKTHPYVPDRIRIIKQELGDKLDFSDYINIEEKKK